MAIEKRAVVGRLGLVVLIGRGKVWELEVKWWLRRCSRSEEGKSTLMLGSQSGAAVPKLMWQQVNSTVEWAVEQGVIYLVRLEWAAVELGRIVVKDHLSRRPSHPVQEHQQEYHPTGK